MKSRIISFSRREREKERESERKGGKEGRKSANKTARRRPVCIKLNPPAENFHRPLHPPEATGKDINSSPSPINRYVSNGDAPIKPAV